MLPTDESHFLALQSLVRSAKTDPVNVGWYVAKAYFLARGESIDQVLAPPPQPQVRTLRLIGLDGSEQCSQRPSASS